MENLHIVHDADAGRFSTIVDGYTATLEYRQTSDSVLEYTRTFVPPEIRRRGIAQRLTTHALEYAASHGLKVNPTCWFVAKVIRESPAFAHIEAIS